MTNGTISNARFLNPNGIVADVANDRLYIAEAGGARNLRIIENATLSTNEPIQNKPLEIFPNPFRTQINLKNESYLATGCNLQMHDTMGRLVFQQDDLKDLSTVDLAALNAGSYILSISTDKGVQSSQIIKL